MYENNLPVPIGVGLSLFSTKNTFSTSTAQTFVQVVFFPLKSTSTCYIYLENVEKFTKTDPDS